MSERELDPRRLSAAQSKKLQRSKSFGELAEELVAEEYGIDHRPNQSSWFDCRHPNTGAKTEVKSTSSAIGDKYPGNGRFRLWRSQHRSLTASDANGVAWYVFVLMDEGNGKIRMRRVKPSTVTQLIADRGGWNKSGHSSFDEQHKLPIDEVFGPWPL